MENFTEPEKIPFNDAINRKSVGARLRSARENSHLSRDQVVAKREAGVSRTTLQQWETGVTEPSMEAISRLAAIYKANAREIIFGKDDENKEEQDSGSMILQEPTGNYDVTTDTASRGQLVARETDKEYAMVPLYDVRAAAGHGTIVEREELTGTVTFKRQWIRQELRANPSDLCLIHVDGESMVPTLQHGDMILLDRRQAQVVPRDGIYVLRMEESLLVKRLQRLPDHKVNATSDNPAYGSFSLSLDVQNEDFTIIGRVVWMSRCI